MERDGFVINADGMQAGGNSRRQLKVRSNVTVVVCIFALIMCVDGKSWRLRLICQLYSFYPLFLLIIIVLSLPICYLFQTMSNIEMHSFNNQMQPLVDNMASDLTEVSFLFSFLHPLICSRKKSTQLTEK